MKKIITLILTLIMLCTTSAGCSNMFATREYYLTISRTSVSMEMGDEFTLVSRYGDSEKKINYSSSNPDIVSVDETGKIKANGVGEAYVIVSVEGVEDQTKTCIVTVTNPIYEIRLNYVKTDYIYVGAKLNVTATMFKDGVITQEKLTVSTAQTQGCTILIGANNNFVFEASEVGEYQLTFSGEKAEVSITLTVIN